MIHVLIHKVFNLIGEIGHKEQKMIKVWTMVTLPEGGWAAEQGTAWLPCFHYRAHLPPAHSDT